MRHGATLEAPRPTDIPPLYPTDKFDTGETRILLDQEPITVPIPRQDHDRAVGRAAVADETVSVLHISSPDEAIKEPGFGEELHQQAQLLLSGRVTVENFADFLTTARQIVRHDGPEGSVFYGPDGKQITGPDADTAALVHSMGTPESWLLPERIEGGLPDLNAGEGLGNHEYVVDRLESIANNLEQRHLELARDPLSGQEVFVDKKRSEISSFDRDQFALDRQELGPLLGIATPDSFMPSEWVRIIDNRLDLIDAIVAGEFSSRIEPDPDPSPSADSSVAPDPPRQEGAHRADDQDLPPRPEESFPPRQAGPSGPTKPPFGYEAGPSSAERPRPKRWKRILVAAAAIAVAATATLFGNTVSKEPKDPNPSVVNTTPSPSAPKSPFQKPPTTPEKPQQADHVMMSIGKEYNPATGEGTIWHAGKSYAARLGYDNLTEWQSVQLTDQLLAFMDKRHPGGMDHKKATLIPPNTKLAFPSATEMTKILQGITNIAPVQAM